MSVLCLDAACGLRDLIDRTLHVLMFCLEPGVLLFYVFVVFTVTLVSSDSSLTN